MQRNRFIPKLEILLQKLLIPAMIITLLNFLLYEITIIPLYIIILLYVFAMISYFLLNRSTRQRLGNTLEVWTSMTVIIGGFLTFTLLGFNYLFSNEETHAQSCKIKQQFPLRLMNQEESEMTAIAYAEITKGQHKRLLILNERLNSKKEVDSVKFRLSHGFLNFPIIRKITL